MSGSVGEDPRLIVDEQGVRGLVTMAGRRVRQGELGALPVLFGLILIAIVFQVQNSHFLTPLNLTNLMAQIAPVGVISVGVVLILLLGEIDLSVGSVSGFCAAITAVLSVKHGVSGPVAVLAGIGAGALIGLFNGFMRAKVGVPSFIVTLAGFIGFSGALLYTLGDTGSVNLNDTFIINLVNLLLPVWLGWVIGVGVVAAHALIVFVSRARRRASGLRPEPLLLDGLRVGVLAAGVLVGVAVMNTDRGRVLPIEGVPLGVVIFLGLVAVFQVITRRTSFGRHLYAVGGNEEAARRAGINVVRVRLAVFVLASSLAAFGGILAASRGYSVNQSSGGGDVLLNAIAAAVIGGTSLFGGRGSVITALLGSLVIGSIANGMDLLALQSSVKFMITGGVLLAAVTVDAIARRGRMSAGRVA